MTTLLGRHRSALLVIDVQNGVVAGAPRREEVIQKIGGLVSRAREQGAPVLWIQHSDQGLVEGTTEWDFVPELTRDEREPLVHKHYGDAFEGTGLERLLADRQVARVVIAGAQTDACIRSTLHGALVRGYDVTLAEDAHTTEDLCEWGSPISAEDAIAYTNLYWRETRAPGRTAETAPAQLITFTPTP